VEDDISIAEFTSDALRVDAVLTAPTFRLRMVLGECSFSGIMVDVWHWFGWVDVDWFHWFPFGL
jgi:hypothetical protein